MKIIIIVICACGMGMQTIRIKSWCHARTRTGDRFGSFLNAFICFEFRFDFCLRICIAFENSNCHSEWPVPEVFIPFIGMRRGQNACHTICIYPSIMINIDENRKRNRITVRVWCASNGFELILPENCRGLPKERINFATQNRRRRHRFIFISMWFSRPHQHRH